jgi:hypothetical protein
MKTKLLALLAVAATCAIIVSHDSWAIGRRGGGGGGGGGRIGGGGGGGGARPNIGGGGGGARPSFSGGGGARPSIGGGGASRPNISVPHGGGGSRPSISQGQLGGGSRPDISRPSTPQIGQGGGGLKPSTRPGGGGSGIANRPDTRPNLPSGGGERPSFPNTSAPGIAANRPGIANRPGGDGIAGKIGGKIGDGSKIGGKTGTRPSPGDISDFLGMHGQLRPDGGSKLPDGKFPDSKIAGKFPDSKIAGKFPDSKFDGRFPGTKGDNRPFIDNRRPSRDRPINIGNQINNNINVRPTWANIDNTRINGIQNNWQTAIKNRPTFNNYLDNHPDRRNYWNRWGDNVRDHWGNYHHHDGWFNQDWWEHHNHAYCGWHYHNAFYNHNWSYWWSAPTWAAASSWFAWPAAPATVWSEPIYYDYGSGGNVTYQGGNVYIGDQQVSSAADFASSAAALATVAPPASEAEAEKSEWMALGTFAVAAHEKDTDPSRIIQLAVNKQGVISGTLYNKQTDQASTIQGQVDKQTQRVAFRVGDADKIVVETGLYNLTQDQAPILVHFGTDKVEQYLLVRLKQSDDEASAGPR